MLDHDTGNLLFVYGTLLPGLAPAEMAGICEQLSPVGDATIQATLYDLGAYPGVVIDGSDTTVRGRIVSVPSPAVWTALDEYEACPTHGSSEGLFRRVPTIAKLAGTNQPMECWVYVYNRPLNAAPRIDGGCWIEHRTRTAIS